MFAMPWPRVFAPGLARRFPVLAIRDFRLLLGDRLLAMSAVGFSLVGVSFAVLNTTGSTTDLSYVLTAQIAPTLLFEYNFLPAGSTWRPYLGAGVNYTTFYDRDSTAAGNAASGGPTKLSLTSSVGPVVTGGVTYRISDRWAAHASDSWSQVKTDLSADTNGIIRTTRISFGPQALVVSVGYSF